MIESIKITKIEKWETNGHNSYTTIEVFLNKRFGRNYVFVYFLDSQFEVHSGNII